MTRFFMTIPEAVQLVVQAGAIGGRGQIYVLDMGEPVRIVDLAESMIRLSGREPGRDIEIEFVGARPGEKLHEELWSDGETVTPSTHEAILLVTRPPIDAEWLEGVLDELEGLVVAGETLELVGRLNAVVQASRRLDGALAEAAADVPSEPARAATEQA
jgi:FlaA1/EpsC-like NDP-sugar epimerase